METIKQQLEINAENIQKSFDVIQEFAAIKNYVITGNLEFKNFTKEFPSNKSKKKFRNSLNTVISHVTMKSANMFLFHLSKYTDSIIKIEYSERELAIKEAKKNWKSARKISEKLMIDYKNIKGDFYLSQKQN